MATGTERSTLHNFTMPGDLRWGRQRFLRCMKVNSGDQISPPHRIEANSSGSSDHHNHLPIQQRRTARDRERERAKDEFASGSPKVGPTHPPPPPPHGGGRRFGDEDDDDDGGIAATREKVMFDLQTAADKMKDAFFKDGGLEEGEVAFSRPPVLPQPPPPPPAAAASASAEGEASRPWNLRTRRAACKMPPASGSGSGKNGGPITAGGGNDGAGKGLRVDAPRPNPGFSPMRVAAASNKSPPTKTEGHVAAAASGEKREREKFSVPLSKREIEDDFFAMVGHRPPRRPKKRARFVQRQLDTLFPGLWLTEVTPDMYKVQESAP